MNSKLIYYLVIGLLVIISGLVYLKQNDTKIRNNPDEHMVVSGAEPLNPTVGTPESDLTQSLAASQEETSFVHLVGAVHNQGVYEVPNGTRLFEVVDLAGGLTDEADPTKINLAQIIMDGKQYKILSVYEVEISPQDNGKVSINQGSQDELMGLTGIGEAKAKAIIKYREDHGVFLKLEDLMNVEGIGESIFNKIKESIILMVQPFG